MNIEEGHKPATNEFGRVVQVVGRRLEEHATMIVAVVCVVLLGAAAVTWWSRYTSASSIEAWTLLESAENVNDFGDVAEKFKGTPAGNWARLREAELNLQSGMAKMFEDREVAVLDLKKATEGFESLAAEKSLDTAILERALWGLAQSLEATSDGDTTKASEVYQRLLKDVPETYYKSLAEQRIAILKTGGAKEFYTWFSKQNPKPATIQPKDGATSELDSMLPPAAKGELDFRPNPPKGEGEKPAADETKKDDAKPESEKPAAETEKPATKAEDATKEDAAKEDDAKPKPEKVEEPAEKSEKDGDKKE